MRTRFFWKDTKSLLGDEFFLLERECFSEKYAITPNTKTEFDQMFKANSLIGEIRNENSLIGMVFFDELVPRKLYYLRVICIKSSCRGQGLATELIQQGIVFLKQGSLYISFVSEADLFVRIFSKLGASHNSHPSMQIRKALYRYNPKLEGHNPGDQIEGYYRLKAGEMISGLYSIFSVED